MDTNRGSLPHLSSLRSCAVGRAESISTQHLSWPCRKLFCLVPFQQEHFALQLEVVNNKADANAALSSSNTHSTSSSGTDFPCNLSSASNNLMGRMFCPDSLSAPDEPCGCGISRGADRGQAQPHTWWQSPTSALSTPGCGICWRQSLLAATCGSV